MSIAGYNLTMIIPFDISPDMHVWETKDFVDNFESELPLVGVDGRG